MTITIRLSISITFSLTII